MRSAAEKLLAAGAAPAVDYGIKERQDGRFEIKWKTTPVPTGASKPPASTDLSPDEPASTGAPVPPAAPAAPTTHAIETRAAAQGDPAPAAAEDPELAAVETPRLIAELARRGYRTAEARQSRSRRPASRSPAEQGCRARRSSSARRDADQAGRHQPLELSLSAPFR
jgi:hypothetical protein